MAEPVLIPDHPDRAVDLLVSDFDDATRLQSLVRVLVGEIQELEETLYSLIVDRLLDASVGAQLDAWGKIVGEPRAGVSDVVYRRFLKARILTNLAEGTIPRILTVAKLITDAISVLYMPTFPAAFILQITVQAFTSAAFRARVFRQILSITPSGVGLQVVEAQLSSFGFADDGDALGFGEGPWAEVIGAVN